MITKIKVQIVFMYACNTYYLTGALWPVSSKAIQFAEVSNLSAHFRVECSVRPYVVCPCLRCAVRHCQMQNNLVQVQHGDRSFASPISRCISHLQFFWVSDLSHLPFADAQKVHQTDSNQGPHDQ